MAATKTLKRKTLAIEVQNRTDKSGDPTYTKKSFSGVKIAATFNKISISILVMHMFHNFYFQI